MIGRLLGAIAASLLIACGGAPRYGRASGTVAALALRNVDWNPSHADLGKVTAVADAGDEVVVFSDAGATVMVAGAVVAVDKSVSQWRSACAIPAPDGSGTWIVSVDGEGRLRRMRARTALEPVSERFGLAKDRVHRVVSFGAGFVGFSLDTQLALADSSAVLRYELGPHRDLAGGGGRGVAMFDDALRLLDPSHHREALYQLPGVLLVAINDEGRIFAATRTALYAENDRGELTLRYVTGESVELKGLVTSGRRAWFSEGTELGVIEGDAVAATNGAKLPPDATLHPSASGDVWTLSSGSLSRWARVETAGFSWERDIQPVFARACAKCHLPNGPAGVDLSLESAWKLKRADIKERVIEQRSMPPKGHTLSDADRKAIELWSGAH